MTVLPNPFQFAGCAELMPANDAAVSAPTPSCDTAAEFHESPLEREIAGDAAAGLGLTDGSDPAAARFVLDESAFLEAIEPLPIFLQAPIEAMRLLARHA